MPLQMRPYGDKVNSMWEPMPIKRLGEWVHIFRDELLQEGKLGSNRIYEAPYYAGKIWAGSLPPLGIDHGLSPNDPLLEPVNE